MKIKVIESQTVAPNKQSIFIKDKDGNLRIILKATIEELLSLAEEVKGGSLDMH